LVQPSHPNNYYLPKFPDSMRKPLAKKIAKYCRAGWWCSAWAEQAALMLIVPKKVGTIHTVINAVKHNANTVKDVTLFPDQDLIQLDVAWAKYCSKIDLSDAYEQAWVEPEDVWKTTFVMVQGVYESLVMQQGDCNAPSTFQRLMNSIFQNYIGIFVHAYLDNIFVFSDMIEEHQKHLELMFNKLCKHSLYLHAEKCELYAKKVECLSHMIDEHSLHADSNKMACIWEWKTPCNYHEVQRFLGLMQYLAHFLPDISVYTSLQSVMTKNSTSFLWWLLHDHCFHMIKHICCTTLVLKPIDPESPEPIWVICDASVFGTGVMYGQGPEWQTYHPAGFLSKTFSDAQRNYCTFEHETIAILEALLKWEDKLISRCIHIVTDNKALEFFQTKCWLSARQTWWMEYLSCFNFDIRYVKGKLNKVADALSHYHQFNSWDDTPLVQHYVFADIHLDPNHEDLPWDWHLEMKNQVIETCSYCPAEASHGTAKGSSRIDQRARHCCSHSVCELWRSEPSFFDWFTIRGEPLGLSISG
jgi:Reverse transcriptase (RNA-dependent DNA polymerase)/RNase H-like domain found in reverse transcriptase